MAKKKTAIGDLIKSDMSRRAIGDETKKTKEAELFSGPAPEKKPPEKKPPAEKPPVKADAAAPAEVPAFPGGGAGFSAFIAAQTRSVGLTNEADLATFYAFLQDQAMRYIRGFDAGRRFHG